jgi:hypothetical protein
MVLGEIKKIFYFINQFGSRRNEVTGWWRKLHNEETNDLYSLPNIFRVKKSRRMRCARHVARVRGEERRILGFGRETRGKETSWETQA